MVEESKSVTNERPKNARWLIDGMAAIRSIKAKEIYREWLIALVNFVTPSADASPLSIELINDTYRSISAKNGTRLKRGNTPQRTYIQAIDQKMLQGNSWSSFFNHIENKMDLIRLGSKFFTSEEGRQQLKLSLAFMEQEKLWEITRDGEQIPSTIAVSSALSSENEETGQPAPPAPKRRRTRKTRAATSTRERTAKYSDSEEEPGIEISAESKELDYIFFGDSSSSDSDLESDEFDWMS
eukprot:gene14282-15769_t